MFTVAPAFAATLNVIELPLARVLNATLGVPTGIGGKRVTTIFSEIEILPLCSTITT